MQTQAYGQPLHFSLIYPLWECFKALVIRSCLLDTERLLDELLLPPNHMCSCSYSWCRFYAQSDLRLPATMCSQALGGRSFPHRTSFPTKLCPTNCPHNLFFWCSLEISLRLPQQDFLRIRGQIWAFGLYPWIAVASHDKSANAWFDAFQRISHSHNTRQLLLMTVPWWVSYTLHGVWASMLGALRLYAWGRLADNTLHICSIFWWSQAMHEPCPSHI